jgi:hypothetical protein
MQNHIALYNSDGELIDRISEQRLARLQALGRIARVVRHRKGHINRAIQFPLPGEGRPLLPADYLGTKYSTKQRLSQGHSCWRLRALGDRPSETELAPAEVRPVFLQVVLDCLSPSKKCNRLPNPASASHL